MIARGLVRTELAAALGVAPATLAFASGAHGKPELLDPPQPVAFNLSHSGEWIVLAWHVTPDAGPLGVDIEHRGGDTRDVMRLARRYFSSAELVALEALEGSARDALFYRLWTLKEAWVKAHGLALAPQLGAVGFSLDDGILRVSNATGFQTGRLLHGEVDVGTWTSLCLLGEESLPLTVEARVGMPLGEWLPLPLQGWQASIAGD